MKKKLTGVVLFLIVFISSFFISPFGGFTNESMKSLFVLALAVILWICEPVPPGGAAVFILVLPPLMGISSLKDMIAPFANSTIFFVIATFGLSAAISKVPLAKRILLFLLKLLGSSIKRIILALMIATALISSVMSNIPATLMFIGVSLSLLELYDDENEKKAAGRALMIALPLSGMMGGSITPAGSSNNLIALSLLSEHGGVHIRFIDWILICAPVVLVMLPFAWFLIIKIFRPAEISRQTLERFVEELKNLPKPDLKEYAVIIISAAMIILWIISSWYPAIDTTIVAVIGLTLMFLPGIELFTWKEFQNEVSWTAILMTGSVLCVGSLINRNGVADWFAQTLFAADSSMSIAFLILNVALFMAVMQVVLPNGPAAIAATSVPVTASALALGINPALLIIPLTFMCSWAMILPLNPVPMLTYSMGYYKITDISKVGIPVLILLSLILSVWIPFITGFIN